MPALSQSEYVQLHRNLARMRHDREKATALIRRVHAHMMQRPMSPGCPVPRGSRFVDGLPRDLSYWLLIGVEY